MNDFTKDELNFILNYMFGGSYRISTKDKESFRTKIQSMIDNYCEHEKICFYFIEKQNLAVEQCVKCQVWGATTSDDNNE